MTMSSTEMTYCCRCMPVTYSSPPLVLQIIGTVHRRHLSSTGTLSSRRTALSIVGIKHRCKCLPLSLLIIRVRHRLHGPPLSMPLAGILHKLNCLPLALSIVIIRYR
jgi:hypothetical protein